MSVIFWLRHIRNVATIIAIALHSLHIDLRWTAKVSLSCVVGNIDLQFRTCVSIATKSLCRQYVEQIFQVLGPRYDANRPHVGWICAGILVGLPAFYKDVRPYVQARKRECRAVFLIETRHILSIYKGRDLRKGFDWLPDADQYVCRFLRCACIRNFRC
jgi:hypothetical protein